jgi:hypothetical protein
MMLGGRTRSGSVIRWLALGGLLVILLAAVLYLRRGTQPTEEAASLVGPSPGRALHATGLTYATRLADGTQLRVEIGEVRQQSRKFGPLSIRPLQELVISNLRVEVRPARTTTSRNGRTPAAGAGESPEPGTGRAPALAIAEPPETGIGEAPASGTGEPRESGTDEPSETTAATDEAASPEERDFVTLALRDLVRNALRGRGGTPPSRVIVHEFDMVVDGESFERLELHGGEASWSAGEPRIRLEQFVQVRFREDGMLSCREAEWDPSRRQLRVPEAYIFRSQGETTTGPSGVFEIHPQAGVIPLRAEPARAPPRAPP